MTLFEETLAELFKQRYFPHNPGNCVHDLLGGRKIILYGAGDGFITFSVFVLRKYGLKAYAVLDRKFKDGGLHAGIPAFSPTGFRPTDEEKANAVVVVTSGKKKYREEMLKCARGLGFKNVVLSSDIYEYHLLHEPPELQIKEFDYYLDNKEKIMACLDLFSDDLSRDIFTGVISTHMQRKPVQIPCHSLEEQYFPSGINLSKGYSRFINCGAYNGDTVMRLNALHGKVDAIACFEPDPENFKLLTRYLRSGHSKIAKSIMAFPYGVLSHETQLRFACGDRINSVISDKGETVIQCVALDYLLPAFRPTFISMDVEGAECKALKGAERLIKEYRPDLAVCVYHSPEHIWDIPIYLKKICPEYKLYLRNYTSFVAETVLYATGP